MPDRIIRERALTSPTLDVLSDGAERFHWRLTVVADDYGRFDADPRVLLARCFPLKVGQLTVAKILGWLEELRAAGLVALYTVADRLYGYYVTWLTHQRKRESKPKFPDPCEADAASGGESPRSAAIGGSRAHPRESLTTESRESRVDVTGPAAAGGMAWVGPEDLIALYNHLAPKELARVVRLTPGRRAKARKYLEIFPERSFWVRCFTELEHSRFLRGISPGQGHEGFRGDLDWILSKGKDGTENAAKVAEGRFRDKEDR